MDSPVALAEALPPSHSLAEAAASSEDNGSEEDLQLKAERALECPCVAELRNGPCGKEFSEAFVCFFKSTAEEKGSDCVGTFLAMQACMLDKPDAFLKDDVKEKHTEDKL